MNIKEFYTANFKQQVEERNKPIDTTQLQLDSVQLFMEQLGYKLHHPQKDYPSLWKGFIRKVDIEGVLLPKCLSFQYTCRLHNAVTEKEYQFTGAVANFPVNVLISACKAKLVEKVYLQRKGKSVKVQQHWVKLVD